MNCRWSSNGWAWADWHTRGRTGEAMRHRPSDLATPENTYTVQIGSAIGAHVGPGAPSGRLLGAGDLHMASRAIPGSLAMAVPHGTICIMIIARTKFRAMNIPTPPWSLFLMGRAREMPGVGQALFRLLKRQHGDRHGRLPFKLCHCQLIRGSCPYNGCRVVG